MSDQELSKPNSGLFIISSVAGGGKSTLISLLLKRHEDLLFSVSCTTRLPRPGDVPGQSYHFLTVDDFKSRIDRDEFIEWAEVHGNYYGTSKLFIENAIQSGHSILMDIDVQGAKIVKGKLPTATTIFILPPSEEIWIERLRSRATDSQEVIERRIHNGKVELSQSDWFDYQIVNDNLETAYRDLEKIIYSEK
jgi:guanylate kinase